MDFCEKHQIVAGFVPLDLQTQRNGDWVKAGDYLRTLIILFKGTGTDGDDPIITVQQASDNGGTGAKGLNFTTIYRKQAADVQTVGQFTKTIQAAADNYTDADGHQQLIWVVEVERSMLDLAGGFSYVRATINDTGTNPQLGCVLYVPLHPVGLPASAL